MARVGALPRVDRVPSCSDSIQTQMLPRGWIRAPDKQASSRRPVYENASSCHDGRGWLSQGLSRKNPAIIIATAEHRAAILEL